MFGLKNKSKDLNTLNKEIKKAKLELEKVNNIVNSKRDELDKINSNIINVLERRNVAEQENRYLDVEIREKKIELECLKEDINKYKKDVILFKDEIRSLELRRESEMKIDIKIKYKKAELEQITKELKEIEDDAENQVKEIEAKCQRYVDELARELKMENDKLESIKKEINGFIIKKNHAKTDVDIKEAEVKRLTSEIKKLEEKESELRELKSETIQLREEKEELEKVIAIYNKEDAVNVSSIAETPRYEFANSSLCKEALEDIRSNQKEMVKNGIAIVCAKDSTVRGNKAKDKKKTNDSIKMMLKCFNNGCDYIIGSLKYNTYDASLKKIEKLFEEINRLNTVNEMFISNVYKGLKVNELDLAFEYVEMKEKEKEEQRRIREQMREEAKRQEELEDIRKRIEKEQKHYENELARALEKQRDAELIKKLRGRIAELEQGKKDVERAETTIKAGYVYVISNEGSFGENVYKIGTTRRLNPFDRVDELGNASVPFKFDVHAMIFSEDCYELETKLHKIFDANRVNKVNKRKEFFNVSLDEIVNAVNNQLGLNVEFTLKATAKEYKESRC